MNLDQAKAKLNSVSKSTAHTNPKVLVSELCAVVKFLLDEIGRVRTPVLVTLETTELDLSDDKLPPCDPYVSPPMMPPEPIHKPSLPPSELDIQMPSVKRPPTMAGNENPDPPIGKRPVPPPPPPPLRLPNNTGLPTYTEQEFGEIG